MSPKAGFILQTEVVPRLRSAIPNSVHCVGAEDGQELMQDAITMAAKLMHNNERKRKKVTPGNVAYYNTQHVRSGRRSVGYSKADVYGSATQLAGRSRLHSLEEVVADDETGGEIFELHDVLGSNQEDPATRAARRLDWAEFYASLPERERAAVDHLIEGKTLGEAGRSLARPGALRSPSLCRCNWVGAKPPPGQIAPLGGRKPLEFEAPHERVVHISRYNDLG